jgi:hypothetical protein
VVEYDSENLKNHEKTKGNFILVEKGAKFINFQNTDEIYKSILNG